MKPKTTLLMQNVFAGDAMMVGDTRIHFRHVRKMSGRIELCIQAPEDLKISFDRQPRPDAPTPTHITPTVLQITENFATTGGER